MNTNVSTESKAYDKRDYSVSMGKANWCSLILAGPIVILFGLVYTGIWGYQKPANEILTMLGDSSRLLMADLILVGILILGIVIHELIHGITWQWAGKKPWSAIKFGFQLRTLTPYAHCREPLSIRAYQLGVLMPGLLTGVIPAIIGVVTGNIWITLLGALFIFAAGGDLVILWLIQTVDKTALVEDHPTRAGCYILSEVADVQGESESNRA